MWPRSAAAGSIFIPPAPARRRRRSPGTRAPPPPAAASASPVTSSVSVPPRSGETWWSSKSSMLIRCAPSACVIPASTPGPVGHVDAQLVQVAGVGEGALEHAPAVVGGLADPAREEAAVARLERGLELLDPAAVLGQRLADRAAVLEEDVDPDARVRAGDARHVAQRAAGGRERLVALDARRAGLVDEQVGERVRQVARQRDEPVVRLRVDRDRRRAERGDEPVHEPVALRLGRARRRQEPGRAVEQVDRRVRGPVRLGAGDRVAADEARARRSPRRGSTSSSRRR